MTVLTDVKLHTTETQDDSPAKNAVLTDDKHTLKSLMGNLPEREQEVLRLKFQNGLSYKEISEITELSVSNVGFILHKTLKELRSQFQQQRERGGLS